MFCIVLVEKKFYSSTQRYWNYIRNGSRLCFLWDTNLDFICIRLLSACQWLKKLSLLIFLCSCILCNPNVHYRIHNTPPPAPVLNQINPVNAPKPTSRRFVLIFFPQRLGFPSGLLPSGFSIKIPVCTSVLSHTCYMPRPSLSWFDQSNNIWWVVQSFLHGHDWNKCNVWP